jgi:hypothetical protein
MGIGDLIQQHQAAGPAAALKHGHDVLLLQGQHLQGKPLVNRLAGDDAGNRGGVGGLDLDLPPLGLREQAWINPLTCK